MQVTVELKNDLAVTGVLHSVDQYLNVKLNNIRVVDEQKYPHMLSVRNCFIRGSVVRYVQVGAAQSSAAQRGGQPRKGAGRDAWAVRVSPGPAPRTLLEPEPPRRLQLRDVETPCGPHTHVAPPMAPAPAQLPPGSVDVELLHDATRREARGG